MENNQELLKKYKEYLIARNQSINYFNSMRVFFKYLSGKNLEFSVVNQETLTDFFNSNNYAPSSKNQFLKSGRSYGDYLQIPKENNAFYQCKLLKVKYEVINYLEEADIEEAKKYLITYFSQRMTPNKIRAVIDFLFDSGVRRSELLNLKRKDINLEEKSAIVLGKGNKERMICFSTGTKKELEIYFNSENEENNAFNLTTNKIQYMFKLLTKYMGKRIYAHLLRHSCGRDLHDKGADLYTISLLFGHANTKTTERYVAPSQKGLKELYRKIKK